MRLTKKDEKFGYYYNGREDKIEADVLNKLGQLEDLMEKYNIKTLSQVESSFIGFVSDYTEEGRNHICQLLKLEDELGINLITLVKAIKQKNIFCKLKNGKVVPCLIKQIPSEYGKELDKAFLVLYAVYDGYSEAGSRTLNNMLFFKDYGKTWALTKEELIDEK